jgi:hypothetical protein
MLTRLKASICEVCKVLIITMTMDIIINTTAAAG